MCYWRISLLANGINGIQRQAAGYLSWRVRTLTVLRQSEVTASVYQLSSNDPTLSEVLVQDAQT